VHDELTLVAERTAGPSRVLAGSVVELARPVPVVEAALPVAELELDFRDPDVECVAVLDAADRVGVITRPHFTGAMTGRLGYGRAVLLRRPTSTITDWSPLVVEPGASVADVATRALQRAFDRRYDDVLVHDEVWRSASAAELMRALIGALADRSTHDPLTRLPGRASTWHALARRCEMVVRSRARVVLILLDVRDMAGIDARYGQARGDLVLREVAKRVVAAMPGGCEAGRVDGDRFAVLATLPPVDDLRGAAEADALRQRLVTELAMPSAGVPQSVWPWLHSSVVWSVPGAANPEEMIREAEVRLRKAKGAVRT